MGGPAAPAAAGNPHVLKKDLKRRIPHPQGAGGLDVAEDTDEQAKKRTKPRAARVLR